MPLDDQQVRSLYRPSAGRYGDPLSTDDRYASWCTAERLADILEAGGKTIRNGHFRAHKELPGLFVDIDRYKGSTMIEQVARERYKPVTDSLGRFVSAIGQSSDWLFMTIPAQPSRLPIGIDLTLARDAMSQSRQEFSKMSRRLRDDGWRERGYCIELVREEHTHDDIDGRVMDYAHYHIVVRVPAGWTHEAWQQFQARLRVLWTRALRRLGRAFPDILPTPQIGPAYVHAERVRSMSRVRTYMIKAPAFAHDIDPDVVRWLDGLVEECDQLRPLGTFKEWRRQRQQEKMASKRPPTIVRSACSAEPYYVVRRPSAASNAHVEAWRERLGITDRRSYLEPRAEAIYEWATHEDAAYRRRLGIDQEVLDEVCAILGRPCVIAPQQPCERASEVQRVDPWHGVQSGYTVLREGSPPPF